ncbi:MAG: hypothetical protein ABIL09_29935 [Gemmatimonadota bacterium]
MTKRIGLAFLALVLLALVVQPAAAQFDKAKDVARHLEKKHEYRITKEDNYLTAKHDDWLNLTVREYKSGLLLRAYLETSAYDEGDLRELCNTLNYNSTAARMYIDNENDLIFEAWYPGEYQEKSFEAMLEAWHKDTIGQASTIKAKLGM